MKIYCEECGTEMEYDEGEGNLADGFTCYNCLEEEEEEEEKKEDKFGDLKTEQMEQDREDSKLNKHTGGN